MACPPNGADTFAAFNGNKGVYQDNVQSYSTVEPAIDLAASSFLGFAWEIAGAPSGVPYSEPLESVPDRVAFSFISPLPADHIGDEGPRIEH